MNIDKLVKTISDDREVFPTELDVFDSLYATHTIALELDDLITSHDKVEEIKKAITGREIGDAFIVYAGDAIKPFAPAFVEGDSEKAIVQMEEGLKEVGRKIVDYLKKLIERIKAFFKKIIDFIRGKKKKQKAKNSKELSLEDKLKYIGDNSTSITIKEGKGDTEIYVTPTSSIKKVTDFTIAQDSVLDLCAMIKALASGEMKPEKYDERLAASIATAPFEKKKISELSSSDIRFATDVYETVLKSDPVKKFEKAYKEVSNIVIPNDVPIETAKKMSNDLFVIQKFLADYTKVISSADKFANSYEIKVEE